MNVESAINLQGMVVTVGTTTDEIMFKKADQFAAEMANRQIIISGGGSSSISIAEARRQWMHRKLDNWIDGVNDE
jgi:hypothetical protein